MIRRSLVVSVVALLLVVPGCSEDPPDSDPNGDTRDGATTSKMDTSSDAPDAEGPVDAAPDGTEPDTSPTDSNVDSDSDLGPTDTSDDTRDGAPTEDAAPDTPPDMSADGTNRDVPRTDAGDPAWRQCGQSSDCILTKNDCCGWCGTPSFSELDSVHKNRTTAHFNDVCNKTNPICPACAKGPIPDAFKPHCSGGLCNKIDLQQYQSCSKNSDCRVRTLDCCEDCQADTSQAALVAINKSFDSQVKSALCPTPTPGCANCPIQYPSTVTAECNSNKRCVLK